MRRSILVALPLALWLAPHDPRAGAPPQAADLAEIRTYAVAVRDGTAYLGQTSGLLILDVAEAGAPRRLGRLDLPGSIHGVTLAGSRAYLAGGSHGLYVVELQDPAKPSLVLRLDRPGSVRQVLVKDHYLFLAEHRHGLAVLDVSVPARPQQVASISTRGEVSALALAGDRLVTAEGQAGGRVFDVRHPATPREVGVLERAEGALDVAFDGQHLLVAAGRRGLVSYAPTGSRAAVLREWPDAAPALAVARFGQLALVSRGGAGLMLIDLGDGSGKPEREPVSVKTAGSHPVGRLTVEGDLSFVALDRWELAIIDLTDAASPRVLLPRPRIMEVRLP